MVHVLTSVLKKVHGALRPDGCLLIVQPAPVNSIIAVEIAGNIEFCEELEEPNFQRYLIATSVSIKSVVDEHLFVIEKEATTPNEGLYHCRPYDSVDEWVTDHQPFCEDLEPFEAVSARIHDVVGLRMHRVLEYYREYKVLLRKS